MLLLSKPFHCSFTPSHSLFHYWLLRYSTADRCWPFTNLLTVLATVWLYFCATEFGASQLLEPLEAAYPAFADEELAKADAIVVLGGGVSGETRYGLGGDLNQAADRLWRGAELYLAGKAPVMVLSGGAVLAGGPPEAALMAQKLRGLGLPDTAWIEESRSRTTRENAQYSRAVLADKGVHHILLVTSASHMRRAAAVFTAQGCMVTAVASDHLKPLRVGPVPGWLPSAWPAPLVLSMSGWGTGYPGWATSHPVDEIVA